MITKDQLKDYQSSAADSAGGAISATQIPASELSAAANAGDTSITVYDAGGFAVDDEFVIDDGTNKERRTITSISTNTLNFGVALSYSYAVDTPVGVKNNLFPDVTAQQANDGITIYRKFFRKNTSASDIYYAVRAWIQKQLSNAALSIGLGVDSADDSDGTQGNMVAMSANAQIALVSDGADTRNVTLVGLNDSGAYTSESVALNGTTEVLSTATFSKLYSANVDSLDASNTITLKQGSGGTTLGTVGPNKKVSFLWFGKMVDGTNTIVDAEGGDVTSYDVSVILGDIAAGGNIPIWCRMMVPSGANAVGNNTTFVETKGETA